MTIEEQIDRRIQTVFEDIGAAMAVDMQAIVGTDWPPSSVPGEAPHRRSGNLQAGIEAVVDHTSPPTLTVVSNAPYSKRLEYAMDREFFWPTIRRWLPDLFQRLRDSFR